jgi:hypothetical protein
MHSNFSWVNCVLFGVLAMLYLDDMHLEVNILLFIIWLPLLTPLEL